VKLEIAAEGGTIEFECEDTVVSARVCEDILRDRTYPSMPFIGPVEVVVDAGANCGAFSVHAARLHPGAVVHAVEPGSEQLAILRRNAARYSNIRVHPIGLHAEDGDAELYRGIGDLGISSVTPSERTSDVGEPIRLRAAGAWAAEEGIERIDVLKLDVEGCEIPVLESLGPLLPQVKVAYVEYGSRQARRDLARLLDPSHELLAGSMLLDQGECVYLRSDLAEGEAASARLVELFFRKVMEEAAP
jgi:FkbM family methyltransferase